MRKLFHLLFALCSVFTSVQAQDFSQFIFDCSKRATDVEATDPLTVSYNTPFFQVELLLPITREVTLQTGDVITVNVDWNEGTYDETTDDTYIITGTLDLPVDVCSPENFFATVDVTVQSALTPDLLSNQIIWLQQDNDNTSTQLDNWWNKYNRSLDLIKIADATRPNVNATGIEGSRLSVDFTKANNDRLRSEGTTIGLSGDFTYYILFKCTDPTSATGQVLFENTDNGTAFVNTGIQAIIISSEIRVDFRKNVAGSTNQQRVAFPFTSTGWHLLVIKHDANGSGNSVNIVKLDGALIKKNIGMEPVVHNSNQLKLGTDGLASPGTPFGGSMAEHVLVATFHDNATEAAVLEYFKTTYPTELGDIAFFDETKFRAIDNVSKAWNGLDTIPRLDGKFDLVGGTLTGEVYYMTQGATINDWITTPILTTNREIQHLKVYGFDSSGKMILFTFHKDNASANDNVGKIMVHREDVAGDHDGAWSSATVVTGRGYPQSALIEDIYQNDGVDEVIYGYEGNMAGQGGVRWFHCTNINDALNPSVWVEHTAITHEGAWWLAGFYNVSGTPRLFFSARNNTSRNPAEVPGVYYLTMASPVTNTWTETTIDATVKDWLHIDVGNFFGNDVDVIAQNFDDGNIYGYNSASSWAKSTLLTNGSGAGTNCKIVPNNIINGRNSFISFTENDWAYHNYYNGSTWSKRRLFQTLGHPADSQIFGIDLDGSGFMTIVYDDNTNLANANVMMFRL